MKRILLFIGWLPEAWLRATQAMWEATKYRKFLPKRLIIKIEFEIYPKEKEEGK